jgi:hypothetical protein
MGKFAYFWVPVVLYTREGLVKYSVRYAWTMSTFAPTSCSLDWTVAYVDRLLTFAFYEVFHLVQYSSWLSVLVWKCQNSVRQRQVIMPGRWTYMFAAYTVLEERDWKARDAVRW